MKKDLLTSNFKLTLRRLKEKEKINKKTIGIKTSEKGKSMPDHFPKPKPLWSGTLTNLNDPYDNY